MALEETLSIRFSALEIAEITRIAKEEARTRGAVVRLLMDEALAARREKSDQARTAHAEKEHTP